MSTRKRSSAASKYSPDILLERSPNIVCVFPLPEEGEKKILDLLAKIVESRAYLFKLYLSIRMQSM
jgi:hypothetical protein